MRSAHAEEDLGGELVQALVVEAARRDRLAIERFAVEGLRRRLRVLAGAGLVAAQLGQDALDLAVGVEARRLLLEDHVGAHAAPGEFLDVSTASPTYPAIKTLTAANIIQGYADSTFHPEENVTRAQAAVIINRVLKKQAASPAGFSDVADSNWYAADVAAIKEAGIINGFSDGTFRPDANMTRAEMAVILQRAFNLPVQAASTYSDIPATYWAHDAIVTMASIDSTSVFAGDRYNATDLATRSFFSTAIYNAMNASK